MKKNRRMRGRILAVVLLAMLMVLQLPVSAARPLDEEQPLTLTLECKAGGGAIAGAHFHLYQVASMDARGGYTLCSSFSVLSGYLEKIENGEDDWQAFEQAALAELERQEPEPLGSGKTDAAGRLTLEIPQAGLYLVIGEQLETDDMTYTASPFLVQLPGLDGETDEWIYAVTASPKGEVRYPEQQKPSEPGDSKLPQTGMLWWPVPVLAAGGLALLLIGWLRRRKI